MIRAILTLLALGAVTSASLLPVLSRQEITTTESPGIVLKDLVGTFTALVRESCPIKIFHDNVLPSGAAIAHNAITVDNVTCNNNGNMAIFPLSDTTRVAAGLAAFSQAGIDRQLAQQAINAANEFEGSFMGVATVPRICGDETFPAGTIFLFSIGDKPFITGVIGFPPIAANRRVMVYVKPGATFICPYSAKARPSPTPSPVAIPPAGGLNEPEPTIEADPTTTGVPDPPAGPEPGETGGQGSGPTTVGNGTQSTESGGDPICFPGNAKVELASGEFKYMSDLELGDVVRVTGNKYSPVFMFTHKLSDVVHEMIRLSTNNGATVTLTSGHYLFVNNGMRPASTAQVGDILQLADGTPTTITQIDTVLGEGLFNPQTIEGSIIVNGIVASTYTTAVQPSTAHSMLAPVRAAFNWFGLTLSALESGADNIARMLPSGVEGVVY